MRCSAHALQALLSDPNLPGEPSATGQSTAGSQPGRQYATGADAAERSTGQSEAAGQRNRQQGISAEQPGAVDGGAVPAKPEVPMHQSRLPRAASRAGNLTPALAPKGTQAGSLRLQPRPASSRAAGQSSRALQMTLLGHLNQSQMPLSSPVPPSRAPQAGSRAGIPTLALAGA